MRFIDCEPLCPLLNEECTLQLCIQDFCPEEVSVSWTKDGETVCSGVFNTPPSLNINGLYSMFSFLKLTPNEDDQASKVTCRVVHSAQREPEERLFILPNLHLKDTCWHPQYMMMGFLKNYIWSSHYWSDGHDEVTLCQHLSSSHYENCCYVWSVS